MSAQSYFPAREPSSYVNRSERPLAAEHGRSPAESDRYLRTKFLRRIAHDIASPTGVTMTVIDELAATAKPELIVMARRGLKRLLRLSEQLALVAELEAGDLAPELAPDDLSAVVKQAVDLAQGIDGRRDVAVHCDLAADAPLTADVDRRILLPVLREMIGNAIRLASSRVEVDIMIGDGVARVRVQDDGPGFPPEIAEHIGERFTPRSGTRGLGLSLSMAKEILESHGGRLSIQPSSLPFGRRGVAGAAVVAELPVR